MGLIKKLKSYDWKMIKENIYFLMHNDLRQYEYDLIYKIKDETLEECARELEDYKANAQTLKILNSDAALRALEQAPKSFIRYGDGEIQLIKGNDIAFQNAEAELSRRLAELLATERDDIYVGLNYAYFQSPNEFAETNKKFYRVHATAFRRFFVDNCSKKTTYLDAACFGAYYRFDDSFDYEAHYSRIKNLFKGKKVAIVSGEGVFEKLEHNVFELAEAQMIVHAPRMNAFSKYNEILEKIEAEVPKDYLICLILGPTATVLPADLTDMGYMAWDIGHIAKDYNAYMSKTEKTAKNIQEFWAPD